MKRIIKTYFKFFVFLFGISLLLVNCEKDNVNNDIESHQIAEINYKNLDELPEVVVALSNINTLGKTNESTSSKTMSTDFGNLSISNILEYVNEDGKETYTFKIEKEIDSLNIFSFENLHLVKVNDIYLAYILKWEPNNEWYVSNNYSFVLEDFTGIQKHYDLDYNLLNEIEFINGQPINSSSSSKNSTTQKARMDYFLDCDGDLASLCNGVPWDCGGDICGWGFSTYCFNINVGGGGNNDDTSSGADVSGGGTRIPSDNDTSPDLVDDGGATVVVIPPTNAQILSSYLGELTEEQIAWANNDLNRTAYNQLIAYLGSCSAVLTEKNSTDCEPVLDFGALALEAHMEGDEVNYALEIIIKKNLNDDYPCHANVVSEAYGVCSPLTQIVLDVFEANDGTNLTFDYSSTLTGNGGTLPTFEYNATTNTCDVIILFRESYLTTATDLSIARTTMHESLHAILVYMYESNMFELPNGTIDPNFSDLANAYTLYLETNNDDGLNSTQHQYITNLVDDVATSIQAYGIANGYSLPFSFYQTLSWSGGMLEFYEPRFLPNGDPTDEYFTLVNTIAAEQDNTDIYYDANGNQILPKGQAPNTSTPCN